MRQSQRQSSINQHLGWRHHQMHDVHRMAIPTKVSSIVPEYTITAIILAFSNGKV